MRAVGKLGELINFKPLPSKTNLVGFIQIKQGKQFP